MLVKPYDQEMLRAGQAITPSDHQAIWSAIVNLTAPSATHVRPVQPRDTAVQLY